MRTEGAYICTGNEAGNSTQAETEAECAAYCWGMESCQFYSYQEYRWEIHINLFKIIANILLRNKVFFACIFVQFHINLSAFVYTCIGVLYSWTILGRVFKCFKNGLLFCYKIPGTIIFL